MRYPEFLKDGGSIGYIAPSFGAYIEPYHSAFKKTLTAFEGMGYKNVLGPNCFEGCGIGISNTPEKCGAELTDMYCRDDSDILLTCGGGELMCTILPHVDFEKIKAAKPKWYMGFSDNTNFTFLSATLTDTAAIYGPCAPAFSITPFQEAVNDAYEMLRGNKLSVTGYEKWEKEGFDTSDGIYKPYNLTEPRVITSVNAASDGSANFSGRILGGCLDCLQTLCGTSFDKVDEFCEKYADDGIIWFIESCDLYPMGISRALWQLKNAGWFKHVKAFLIGRPYCYGQSLMGLDHRAAYTNILSDFGVPIILDLDIGHLPPMMPIIVGAKANVAVNGQDFKMDFVLN